MSIVSLRKHNRRVYLLPLVHLAAFSLICLGDFIPHLQNLLRGMEFLIFADMPVSLLAVGLAMGNHEVQALAWIGVVGTLWWYGVSLEIRAIYRVGRASHRP